MKAPVSQILTEDGRVTGVRVGNKENSQVDIYAPIVISDAGTVQPNGQLLNRKHAEDYPIPWQHKTSHNNTPIEYDRL